jgi:hypothetical protein
MKARVWFSSSSVDTDVFAIVRLLDAEGAEIDFIGAHARVPVTLGWLRASQRQTDSVGSASYQQVYYNTEQAKLVPREEYPLDIEIWPSNIVVPVGYKLVLDIRGHDSQYPGTKRIHHTEEVAPFVRTVFSIFKWNAGRSRCRFHRGQHREVSFIRGLVRKT